MFAPDTKAWAAYNKAARESGHLRDVTQKCRSCEGTGEMNVHDLHAHRPVPFNTKVTCPYCKGYCTITTEEYK